MCKEYDFSKGVRGKHVTILAVQSVIKKYKKYFRKQPRIHLDSENLHLEFTMLNAYSRNLNIGEFETLMDNLRDEILGALEKKGVTWFEFWDCDSTSMNFLYKGANNELER